MVELSKQEKIQRIKSDVWQQIRFIPSNQPVASKTLESMYNLSGAQIRDIIRELRQDGCLIGSIAKKEGCHGGYYAIQSTEELRQTLQHLRNRMISIGHTIGAMELSWLKRCAYENDGQTLMQI